MAVSGFGAGSLPAMAVSEADRVKMLEALAVDESLKATQRLRAIEELGRIDSRRRMQEGKSEARPEGDAPYPMEDLWELEVERRARVRRRERRRVGA
jgi:hypothetical protein